MPVRKHPPKALNLPLTTCTTTLSKTRSHLGNKSSRVTQMTPWKKLEVSKTISMANREQCRGEVRCARQSVKALQSSVLTESPVYE